jgi:hypothetical protein
MRKSQASQTSEMSDREGRLSVNIARVAMRLRLSLLVDLLFEVGLLLAEDYRYVRSLQNAQMVKQESDLWTLAGFALRKKGREIFAIFCDVLRAVRGLAFTATNVTSGGSVGAGRPVSADGACSAGDVRGHEVQPRDLVGVTAFSLQVSSQSSQLSVAREVSGQQRRWLGEAMVGPYPLQQCEPHPSEMTVYGYVCVAVSLCMILT